MVDPASAGTSALDGTRVPCLRDNALYLDPLLEEPPVRSTASRETWREYERLVAAARAACSVCPLLADCLYWAVAESDVAGYVACTTPKQRTAIRRMIGVTVEVGGLGRVRGCACTARPGRRTPSARATSRRVAGGACAPVGLLGVDGQEAVASWPQQRRSAVTARDPGGPAAADHGRGVRGLRAGRRTSPDYVSRLLRSRVSGGGLSSAVRRARRTSRRGKPLVPTPRLPSSQASWLVN